MIMMLIFFRRTFSATNGNAFANESNIVLIQLFNRKTSYQKKKTILLNTKNLPEKKNLNVLKSLEYAQKCWTCSSWYYSARLTWLKIHKFIRDYDLATQLTFQILYNSRKISYEFDVWNELTDVPRENASPFLYHKQK